MLADAEMAAEMEAVIRFVDDLLGPETPEHMAAKISACFSGSSTSAGQFQFHHSGTMPSLPTRTAFLTVIASTLI